MFAPAPDTEITFARGTEYRLELARPLKVEDPDLSFSSLPAHPLSQGIRNETQAVIDALPSQRAERVSGGSADLVNLILVGSAESVARAFQAAGWSTSDPKAVRSVLRTYYSIMMRRGYKNAPMTTMVLDGSHSDIELQKSLDTFARRHHLRVWWRAQKAQGESVWAATATEDTGIRFSRRARTFTHFIDADVDAERTKVVDDLLYTGCVSEAGLIERNNLPANLEDRTGTQLKTDGRVAVLRMSECAEPRVMPGVGTSGRTNILRLLGASLRTELIRSNFISLAYNGVSLTSATRRFLFGRPARDDTGAALTRQQVVWLSQEESVTRKPVPPCVTAP
jgi:hypothetical protein